MAWRITPQIVRGEIDNRLKGMVTGKIWLCGQTEPITLQLRGHPDGDLAGRRLEFVNPDPDGSTELVGLHAVQSGVLGDFTAARMVKVPTIPFEELVKSKGNFPFYWSACLYLEWFSEANGRVVIESTDFQWSCSEPSWTLTCEDIVKQQKLNAQAWSGFLNSLAHCLDQETAPAPAQAMEPVLAEDVEDEEAIDRLLRINELKHKVDQLSGGQMMVGGNGGLPLSIEEEFWENVLNFEKAPLQPRKETLNGIALPPAETLNDQQVHEALWKIIGEMAKQFVYLNSTDHLSDRELYTLLVGTILEESAPVLAPGWRNHICIDEYDSATEEAEDIYLRYYACPEMRERWAKDFPEAIIPPHQDPPYDRDRLLPKAEELEKFNRASRSDRSDSSDRSD